MQKQKSFQQIVIQKNSFIRGNFSKLEIRDLKLLKLLVSKVNSTDIQFQSFYSFSKKEAQILLDCKESNIHSYVKSSLRNLASVFVCVTDSNEVEVEVSLIGKIIYEKKTGVYKVPLSDDLKDYLLDIKKEFTRYDLSNLVSLKQKEQIKLYEYIKSISFDVFILSIGKLRSIMEIHKSSYDSFFNFHKKPKETVSSLNKSTDIKVSFLILKDKSNVNKNIQFKIQRLGQMLKVTAELNLLINTKERFVGKMLVLNGDTFTVEDIVENDEVTVFTSNSELKLIGKLIFYNLEACCKYLEKSILK